MRIEKIEIIGFKSFCDKTVLQLHPGMTAIVGPNGCGKSNVVDAFKWVLGEQSAKSLRGGKMDDVIFAGSEARKARGMADVTLHVSGLGQPGNGEGSVTQVTRRLYRSGESEYLMNRQPCRLKDIKDVFLDTGLEVKSYSIMEQDRISALLTAKPEDRRFLIEEVAGVVKYRVRRNEAQSKLESSRANLQRINDIVAEVKRQINSLDRQVKRAERYKKLMEELRAIDLRLASEAHASLVAAGQDVNRSLAAAREEDSAMRAELASKEAAIETRRIGLAEAGKGLEALRADLQRVEREMAEVERSLAVTRSEKENLKEYSGKLLQQAEDNRGRRKALEDRAAELASLKANLEREVEALRARAAEREDALRAEREEVEAQEARIEEKRNEAMRAAEHLSAVKAEEQRLVSSLDALNAREGSLSAEIGELKAQRDDVEASLAALDAGMVDRRSAVLAIEDETGVLAAEIEGLRARVEGLKADAQRAREALLSEAARLSSFEDMAAEEKAGETLEGVHVLAAISDVLDVPQEYERAIEAALSEVIKGHVLSTRAEVPAAVRELKQKEGGRTAFMPLDAGGRGPDASRPDGSIAWAGSVVSAREGFEQAAINLLLNVAIVRDIEAAMGISSSATLVTLDGELVMPSGVVIAGRSRGILTLKRQVREAREESERLRVRAESLQGEAASVASVLGEREAHFAALRERAAEAGRELSMMRLDAEKQTAELERAYRRLAHLSLEMGVIAKERGDLKGLAEEKEREVARAEETRRVAVVEIEEMQAEVGGKKAALEGRRAEVLDLRLSLNSAEERLTAMAAEDASLSAQFEEVDRNEGFIAQEESATRARIEEKERDEEEKEAGLRALAVQAGEASSGVSRRQGEIEAEAEALAEVERGLKVLRAAIEEASHRLSELEVRRAENGLRMENLVQNISNAYAVDLATLEAAPPEPDDRERQEDIKQKIESLGPVSLGSIEEYEELKTRYDFLSRQQEDLQKSIAELEEAISRINTTTRKRLRDAFTALNEKFSEVFRSLFGGGRAELILTDEQNILETGIEIIAQPPGKKLQNIGLLSGGEKSLGAIALLFASFLIKPAPLCVLDEADAALDESNTGKFADLLRTLSKEIQFIVVTHNRITMEAADYIYGVTMEEPGSTKTISLQMTGA